MMPETCWESVDNKHLTVASCWFFLSNFTICMCHIILSFADCQALSHFFTLSHKGHHFGTKFINIKSVFWFSHSKKNSARYYHNWGMQWSSWLRHCITNWKVAGSKISDVVIGIFHRHNPSSHTMALGLTNQPPTEMSNRNEYQEYFLGGGKGVRLTTLPPLCADCLEICEPQPPGTLRDCPGLIILPLTIIHVHRSPRKVLVIVRFLMKLDFSWKIF